MGSCEPRTLSPESSWSSCDDHLNEPSAISGAGDGDRTHGPLLGVHEMLSVLRDAESEGYYHRLAATVPKNIIHEALSLVKRAVAEGKIRKSRGALFVAIVKRAAAARGLAVRAP